MDRWPNRRTLRHLCLHSALPLMAIYQCIKFHLIPFYTFRDMLQAKIKMNTMLSTFFRFSLGVLCIVYRKYLWLTISYREPCVFFFFFFFFEFCLQIFTIQLILPCTYAISMLSGIFYEKICLAFLH